jgi:uncharacterized protein YcfJ
MRKLIAAAFATALATSFMVPAFAEAATTPAQRRAAAERQEARDYAYRKCMSKRKTTGTVIGAVGGALLGGAVAGNRSNTAGTIIGAGAGGYAGNRIAKKRASTHC